MTKRYLLTTYLGEDGREQMVINEDLRKDILSAIDMMRNYEIEIGVSNSERYDVYYYDAGELDDMLDIAEISAEEIDTLIKFNINIGTGEDGFSDIKYTLRTLKETVEQLKEEFAED